MPKRIDLLVVEDDEKTCLEYEEFCNGRDDVYLIGTSAHSGEALRMTEEFQPNAVILDLELTYGSGSGLDYLLDFNKLQLNVTPYVLVVTNNISRSTHAAVRHMGADFIMVKSQPDYSVENVINFLRSIMDSIPDMSANREAGGSPIKKRMEEDYNKKVLKKIGTELDIIGISPRFKGRNYLRDAIEMICRKEQSYICNDIAKKYQKTSASVERAMQNAIDHAWKTTDITTLEEHYRAYVNPKKGVPTITEFIYYYADKVKNDLN